MTRRETMPATPERIARGEVMLDRIALTDDKTGKVTGTAEAYRITTRLERMRKRGEITDREYKAGSKFLDDLAATEASTRSCLNRDAGGDPIMAIITNGFRMGMAAIRVRNAAVVIGPQMANLVLWVGWKGRPASEWAREQHLLPRTGADLLGLALRKLADHYGLDTD